MAGFENPDPGYMTVRQVSEYLQINEKKIYGLVNDQAIPATRVTGKWMFPRELVDRWMLESCHRGLLLDKLVIAGPDDPLLLRLLDSIGQQNESRALVSHAVRATRPALDLLASGRADIALLNWGLASQSHIRHPALLQLHGGGEWILVAGVRREIGILYRPGDPATESDIESRLADPGYRWVRRDNVDGVWRLFIDVAVEMHLDLSNLNLVTRAAGERDAGAAIRAGVADFAPAARATATEFGLGFYALGEEKLDFALRRELWFRRMFQTLLAGLRSRELHQYAEQLGGYEFENTGELLWGDR